MLAYNAEFFFNNLFINFKMFYNIEVQFKNIMRRRKGERKREKHASTIYQRKL